MALKRVTDTQPLLRLCCINEEEGMGACDAALGVSLGETASSADLGGSSKYSNENFEDRSGERFRVNSSWTRVSRS
jgi:hypothetical protein